jgi:hypothetical protein
MTRALFVVVLCVSACADDPVGEGVLESQGELELACAEQAESFCDGFEAVSDSCIVVFGEDCILPFDESCSCRERYETWCLDAWTVHEGVDAIPAEDHEACLEAIAENECVPVVGLWWRLPNECSPASCPAGACPE